MWKNADLNSLISETPLFQQNNHFLITSFLIAMFVSEWCLWRAMPTPQTSPQGRMKGPMGTNFFTKFFTHNFDISISHRELTLYTIQIHIFRPLNFMHINNCFKSFSINYNAAPKLFAKHSFFQYKL